MISLSALGHRFAGHRGRDALGAGVGEVLHQLQLAFRRAARLLRDVQRDAEILGGGLGAVDDLLDERVALRMGDEADRLGLVQPAAVAAASATALAASLAVMFLKRMKYSSRFACCC